MAYAATLQAYTCDIRLITIYTHVTYLKHQETISYSTSDCICTTAESLSGSTLYIATLEGDKCNMRLITLIAGMATSEMQSENGHTAYMV